MNKTPTNHELDLRDQQCYLPVFKRFPIAFERGEGARLYDVEGNAYIDMLAGIAVNSLGHCHPEVVRAIQTQAERLMHVSNFYTTPQQVALCERLVAISGLERVFLTNSGAESVEAAIKIARKYGHSRGRGGHIISFEGSFHGRTLATIATGKAAMQHGFEPIPAGFTQVPFEDEKSLLDRITSETAAILIEPIQGEGGVRPVNPGFLAFLRRTCDELGMLLIFDEIQCGIGRTGRWFAKDHYGIQPDIMTLAKALGSGIPIGATLCREEVAAVMAPGDHGTTFGGNPLACSAALATLDIIAREDLLKQATVKGEWLREKIRNWSHPAIRDIRGLGLMIGIEFEFETKALSEEMHRRRVLVNASPSSRSATVCW
jgi:acetylornithine/N-succinyldiaminopimelate aminotransferase